MPTRPPTPRSALHAVSLVIAICAAGCAAKPSAAPERSDAAAAQRPNTGPVVRETLTPEVGRLLEARMRRHGPRMTELLRAVIILDWDGVQRTSEQLAEEPSIAAPLSGDQDSLNAQLPPSFFVRQQALYKALRELSDAGAHESDHEVKVAFNGVASACLDCHAAYLPSTHQPRVLSVPAL